MNKYSTLYTECKQCISSINLYAKTTTFDLFLYLIVSISVPTTTIIFSFSYLGKLHFLHILTANALPCILNYLFYLFYK